MGLKYNYLPPDGEGARPMSRQSRRLLSPTVVLEQNSMSERDANSEAEAGTLTGLWMHY